MVIHCNIRLDGKSLYCLAVNSEDEDVKNTFVKYTRDNYRVLITSYESITTYGEHFKGMTIDLLVCDEGHRLKNMNTKQYKVLSSLRTRKRILITGTPLQNNLMELYACTMFVIPSLFRSEKSFKKVYGDPIEKGRVKNAMRKDKDLSQVRSKELMDIINTFMIRRTQKILEKYLPPRHEYLVYIKPSEIQISMYNRCINTYLQKKQDKSVSSTGEMFVILSTLRKILTHPHLLNSTDSNDTSVDMKKYIDQCREDKAPTSSFDDIKSISTKLLFVSQLLDDTNGDSKLIIVSYFTSTLDMIGLYLDSRSMKSCRLDGSMSAKERQKQLGIFKNTSLDVNVLLLGAKAGGVGLNIVAANKMVMLDLDWNPSNDAQVMGRIYRKGQNKPVYIYRLISTGTVEEKIMDRQMDKRELSGMMDNDDNISCKFTPDELKRLFTPYKPECSVHVKKRVNNMKNMIDYNVSLNHIKFCIDYVVIDIDDDNDDCIDNDDEHIDMSDGVNDIIDNEDNSNDDKVDEERKYDSKDKEEDRINEDNDVDDKEEAGVDDDREEAEVDDDRDEVDDDMDELDERKLDSKHMMLQKKSPKDYGMMADEILEMFKQCLT